MHSLLVYFLSYISLSPQDDVHRQINRQTKPLWTCVSQCVTRSTHLLQLIAFRVYLQTSLERYKPVLRADSF
jgi:uncharacterized membrane protein YozB (DUF420 family)